MLIGLIASVVGAIALVGGVHMIDVSRQKIGEQRIEQKYAPIVSICDTWADGSRKLKPAECGATIRSRLAAGDAALAANETLKTDLFKLKGERQECSDEVDRLKRMGKRSADLAAARKPEDDRKLAEIAPEKAALIEALGLPEAGTCEQRLARRDAMWARIAAQRERDFPKDKAIQRTDDVTIKPPK